MQIKLNYLKIENFKGVKTFELNLGGDSAIIAGKNGSGKTTVADAFYWCLSGSDSLQQSKFNALELDASGTAIREQDAKVEIHLFIGSKLVKFRREYGQKWTKKRDQAVAELTGHPTRYYIDGVKKSKREYEDSIKGICDPEIMRCLSDVRYFVEKTKPEFRRNLLVDIAGAVPGDLMELELVDFMAGRTADECLTILNDDRKRLEKDIDAMPDRIDELKKMAPDVAGTSESALRDDLKKIDNNIAGKKNAILAIKSGLAVTELKKEQAELAAQVAGVDESALREKDKEAAKIDNDIIAMQQAAIMTNDRIIEISQRKDRLIDQWTGINSERLVLSDNCRTCGQPLPPDLITRQQDDFNADKAARLKKIDDQGRETSKQLKELTDKKASYSRGIDIAKQELGNLDLERNKIVVGIEAKKAPLIERQREIELKILSIAEDTQPEIDAVETALSDLQKEKGRIEERLLDFVQLEKCNRRIKEREDQQAELIGQYELILSRLNMLEEYSIKRSEYIEKNVNSKFEITQWKLFEQLVNGGTREICEPMRDGVPYSSDLNTGSRINVGLDIIKTLSAHFKISMPIFIDNAESVTGWIDFDGQTIKLAANTEFEKLEVIAG